MGMFDDLVEKYSAAPAGPAPATPASVGMFDDLIQKYDRPLHDGAVDAAIQLPTGIAKGLGGFVDTVIGGMTKMVVNNPVTMLTGNARGKDVLANLVDDTLQQISAKRAASEALPKPETTAGRYASSAGEMIGESLPLLAGSYAAAPGIAAQAASAPAQTMLGRAFQSGAQQAVNAPVRTAVLDVAGAGTAGVARQGAEDAGYGRVGQFAASLAGGLAPGVAASYASRGAGAPIGGEAAQSLARQREQSAARDAQIFMDEGVRPFGPAFNQGPVASVGKQLTETPLVGAPLRNNLDETYQGLAQYRDRLANEISPIATPETAGVALTQGLDRFKNARLSQLPAQTVEGVGVPSARQGPANVTMSRGATKIANQAAPIRTAIEADVTQTTRGVTVPAAQARERFLTQRTTPADLTDAELSTVIRTPAADTSLAARSEALYERAWRMVPDLRRIDNSRNPNLLNAVNTRSAMSGIEDNIASQISGQGRINGELAQRILNPRSNFQLEDLRSIRTEIGRSLTNFSPVAQNTLDRTQLKQLYGAISRDIEIGLETLANRATVRTQLGGNRADAVPIETARQAAGALRAMRTADRYSRMSIERMDRFSQVIGAQSPEAAARVVTRSMVDGTSGNAGLVRTAMAGLRPEERAQFGSLVVREMGKPLPSARGIVQETGFSAQTFVTNYQRMSPQSRALVFSPEHQRSLDRLFAMANRVANVEALANTSRSGTNTMNLSALTGAAYAVAQGDVVTPLAIGGSGLAASVLMASPKYTQWMTQYIRLRAAVRDGSDRSFAPLIRHINSLGNDARLHPELVPAYIAATKDVEQKRSAR